MLIVARSLPSRPYLQLSLKAALCVPLQLYVRRHFFFPPGRLVAYYDGVTSQVRAETQVMRHHHLLSLTRQHVVSQVKAVRLELSGINSPFCLGILSCPAAACFKGGRAPELSTLPKQCLGFCTGCIRRKPTAEVLGASAWPANMSQNTTRRCREQAANWPDPAQSFGALINLAVLLQETYYELLLAGQFIDEEERSVLRWGRNAKVRRTDSRWRVEFTENRDVLCSLRGMHCLDST